MLNDHMLVRIGGGWDTLEHYLMTHAPSKEGIKGKMILFSSGLSITSRIFSLYPGNSILKTFICENLNFCWLQNCSQVS